MNLGEKLRRQINNTVCQRVSIHWQHSYLPVTNYQKTNGFHRYPAPATATESGHLTLSLAIFTFPGYLKFTPSGSKAAGNT
jgi:hypothetical protein